jgi:N-acyl-D-aspartate/D-glutamate deacylase
VAEQRRRDGAHSEEAGILRGLANWERLIIVETFAPENADATGRTVGDVAADRRVRESLIVVLLRFAHPQRLGGRLVGPAVHHRHPLM